MNRYSNRRKKAIIYLGFIIVFILLKKVHAQPAIKIDPEFMTLAPIGLDPNNNTIERTISVTNTGTDLLTINVVGSTCGCVSSYIMDNTIAPGEKGTITLQIDFSKSVSSAKKQTQRIVFSTNDPKQPYVNFDIILEDKRERKDVSVGPTEIVQELTKEQIQSNIGISEQIFILDLWQKQLEITEIQSSSNLITCFYDITYHCSKGNETHVFRINTRFYPIDKVGGVYKEWIKFSTNHPDFPSMAVPITYHIRSGIRIVPETLIFDGNSEQDSVKTIRIKSLDKNNILEIAGIEVNDAWLSVKQFQVEPNVIDLNVSIADIHTDNDVDSRSTVKTIKSEIVIKILKPEKIERTIEVLLIHRY